MSHTLSNSHIKTISKATIQSEASTFPPSIKEMVDIPQSFVSAEKRVAKSNPVAIGTRGTVGSLVMQEIEYFSRLDLDGCSSSNKSQHQLSDLASTGKFSRSKLEPLIVVPGKKKPGNKRLIPSMCSMVKVAESNQPKACSRYTYLNLKADLERLQP
ncbi:hypothetical protein CDL12_11510 [Handroanthus impetiginosus]|uniref:Uncharacterized protein n=1 Tax=Handroanthus impetiginosus TaxID=429701 RepID=A0A2G9HE99_9LAMI|nr:hypothetical protein CDL12_11510 [Handroanthus impetiginosus]